MRSTWDPMVGMDLGEGCGGYATPLPQSFLSGAPSPKKNQGSALAWWNIYVSQNVVTVYWRLCDLHNEVKPDIGTVTQMSGIRYVPLKQWSRWAEWIWNWHKWSGNNGSVVTLIYMPNFTNEMNCCTDNSECTLNSWILLFSWCIFPT